MAGSDLCSRRDGAGGGKEGCGFTILLVDARPWTREALARAFQAASRDLRVWPVGAAAELVQAKTESAAAIVLFNLSGIPLADGFVTDAMATARACLPGVPVAALSECTDAAAILAAVDGGLRGYIPLSSEFRLVINALRFVVAGGTFIPAELVLGRLDAPTATGAPPQAPSMSALRVSAPSVALRGTDPAGAASSAHALTPREQTVLERVREGKSNKHIARELAMCEATVKVHVHHIMRKLGVINRTQVALWAEHLFDGKPRKGCNKSDI